MRRAVSAVVAASIVCGGCSFKRLRSEPTYSAASLQALSAPPACNQDSGAPVFDTIVGGVGLAMVGLGIGLAATAKGPKADDQRSGGAGNIVMGLGFAIPFGASAVWGFGHRGNCRDAHAQWNDMRGRTAGNAAFAKADVQFEQKSDRFLRTETLALRDLELEPQDVEALFVASKSPQEKVVRLVIRQDGDPCLAAGLDFLVDGEPINFKPKTYGGTSNRVAVYGFPINFTSDHAELDGVTLEQLEQIGAGKIVETRVCKKEGVLTLEQIAAIGEYARRVREVFGPPDVVLPPAEPAPEAPPAATPAPPAQPAPSP